MNKYIRVLVVIFLILGVILLAKNNAAWASPASDVEPSSRAEDQSSVSADKSDPGSVKPPPRFVFITESGTYSIGGFCTYTVEFLEPGVSVRVALERPLPRPLPDGVHKVRQGCRVTYYLHGQRIDEFTPELGSSQICFAVTPQKDNKVYFYTVYSSAPVWGPTSETNVETGSACSAAGPSAVYVGTFQNP